MKSDNIFISAYLFPFKMLYNMLNWLWIKYPKFIIEKEKIAFAELWPNAKFNDKSDPESPNFDYSTYRVVESGVSYEAKLKVIEYIKKNIIWMKPFEIVSRLARYLRDKVWVLVPLPIFIIPVYILKDHISITIRFM